VIGKTREFGMRRLLLGAGALTLLLAGCTGASHVKNLQPPSAPASPSVTVPASAALPQLPLGQVPAKMQLGVDIDLYTYPGQDFAAAAATDIAYVVGLHANSVSVSFPFFMSGSRANSVHTTAATPTPSQLAVLIHDAEQAGLYVSIRPLLDETSLGQPRGHWIPADPAAWFASYQQFLAPYAAMAQAQHAQVFIVGTEFSQFATSQRWNSLDRALRRGYHGTLACSDNWDSAPYAGNCGADVSETVDAYHPQSGDLLTGWEAFDRALPHGTVEAEVGIAAVSGAGQTPWQSHWDVRSLDQSVQARWFTAACQAAASTHLGGIYFWPLNYSQTIGSGPTPAYQGWWAGGQGAHAIATCFAALEKAGQ
jgi:hypothetical protein